MYKTHACKYYTQELCWDCFYESSNFANLLGLIFLDQVWIKNFTLVEYINLFWIVACDIYKTKIVAPQTVIILHTMKIT